MRGQTEVTRSLSFLSLKVLGGSSMWLKTWQERRRLSSDLCLCCLGRVKLTE